MKGSTTQRKPSTTPTTTSSIASYSAQRSRQGEVYEDYSEAVENWREKLKQKRKQSLNSNLSEDDPLSPTPNVETFTPSPTKKLDEPKSTYIRSSPSPPPPPRPPPPQPTITNVVPSSSSSTTNISTKQLTISNRTESKSPSPQRKGPARVHEVFIQKPIEVRSFGFKLDGGPAQNRPVYISTLEDGSPADKAGLCVDDEVISMNDENIEHLTSDQVRKILKERNLRGSIKLIVKTYEDGVEDTSQTVTTVPTTQHNRTPSPQKPLSNSNSNIPASTIQHSRTPSPQKPLSNSNTYTSASTTQHSRTPSPQKPLSNLNINIPTSTSPIKTTSTILMSSTTPPNNAQSPIYTFLPFTPPPSSNNPSPAETTTTNIPVQQTPAPALNIFAPKPFRSTASINLETQNSNEKTTDLVEQSLSTVSKSSSRDVVNTLLSNPTLISSNLIDPPSSSLTNSSKHPPPPPPPLTSVESLLHGTTDFNSNDQQRNESPISQVRSSVEKQMNQLQQELLLGFPHTQTTREQRPINIPIDFTNAATSSSLPIKKSSSDQQENFNSNYNRNSNLHNNPNENFNHYYDTNNQQRPSSSYSKRTNQESTLTNRPSTAHSTDRTVNELRVNLSSPSTFQQQRITNKQLHSTLNQAPKKSHYEDQSWIADDQRKPMITPPPPPTSASQYSSYNNGKNTNDRRSASLNPHHQDVRIDRQPPNQLTMFHYGEHPTEPRHHHHHSRSTQQQQQKDYDPTINRHHHPQSKNRVKSPIRTTINSNNNRVLSVSGKLRCSRCNDELGQGSAMVIESLGLYYHIECFRCYVCNIPLSSSFEGTDVRVRSNRLHCQNCFSDENGAWRSNV